ncbi:MAG: hydrogenase expression/formation protein HypE [Candidatus Omnitrophica bacterium]|nr:hydrogenase expression/formation protein HypE [Candidatus Omnitrophota bacterium]MDD5027149.1 hydrogenase expression/formation protein HypE [Candidatus Omnitrophota bacterium]MDD5661613.1 hydrogenase expression/formation protein HypE [Candidatus Omnitrophota bacterium]
MATKKILLGHGSGGKLMHDFIKETLLKKLNNPILSRLSDSAVIGCEGKIAFTTDSFVVSPLFFPGGDIGKLAIAGTVNDLVMLGAVPEYISLALVMEEGLEQGLLERVVDSIAFYAKAAGVKIVTGDTKVVEKGAADKLFINTSGIGRLVSKKEFSVKNISCGDKLIITGNIAEHGLAILAKRKELSLRFNIKSDCQALNGLIIPLLKQARGIKFMRDPTRGGLATTLNEITEGSRLGIVIDEKNIPFSAKVRVASELLGIDPLYVANEGKAVLAVDYREADKIIGFLRRHPLGRNARIIGTVVERPRGRVILRTIFNTERVLDMLISEPLPRIC